MLRFLLGRVAVTILTALCLTFAIFALTNLKPKLVKLAKTEAESRMTDEEVDSVYDQFDVTLEDSDLLREVELTTNLIIAASEAEEPLSLEEIDRILGVVPHPRTGD